MAKKIKKAAKERPPRLSTEMEAELLDQAKDACAFLGITLREFTESAFRRKLSDARRKAGGAIPGRKNRQLRRGKRLG